MELLQLIKDAYDNLRVNGMQYGKRLNAFLLRSRRKIRLSTFTFSIQQYTGSSSQCNNTRKRKRFQTGNKEVKLPFLVGDMISYIENLMESVKKLLEIAGACSKVA